MKRLSVLLGLLLVGSLVILTTLQAQETYSVGPASATNVTTLTQVITGQNGDICARYGLVRTCTQAQVCTAASTPGGASCTAAQARTAQVRIYPLTQPGREEYVTQEIALKKFNELVAAQASENKRAFCVGWLAANTTQRNAACTDLSLATGCDPGC